MRCGARSLLLLLLLPPSPSPSSSGSYEDLRPLLADEPCFRRGARSLLLLLLLGGSMMISVCLTHIGRLHMEAVPFSHQHISAADAASLAAPSSSGSYVPPSPPRRPPRYKYAPSHTLAIKHVLTRALLRVVAYSAGAWCGPCTALKPTLRSVADDLDGCVPLNARRLLSTRVEQRFSIALHRGHPGSECAECSPLPGPRRLGSSTVQNTRKSRLGTAFP